MQGVQNFKVYSVLFFGQPNVAETTAPDFQTVILNVISSSVHDINWKWKSSMQFDVC